MQDKLTNTCPSTTSAHCDQWHGVLGNSINELHPHFPWPHITYEHTNTRPYSLFRVISFRRQDCEVSIMMSPYLYCINVSPVVHSSKYTHSHLCIPRLHFCSVVVIFLTGQLTCPTFSHADAGDIIAAHLPKLKNLRKVKVKYMNPVPILLSARSCGKLDKVVIEDPQHCKVGFLYTSVTPIHGQFTIFRRLG